MQAVDRNTHLVAVPRVYRNRPYSPAFNRRPRPEALCDVIYLIDDDAQSGKDLCARVMPHTTKVAAFTSATEYLAHVREDTAACIVLNTHALDVNAIDLQKRLSEQGHPPVIFVSDHGDIGCIVRAIKAGAIEFLTKPLDLQALVAAVEEAFVQDRKLRRKKAEVAELAARFSLLTPREREVLPLVVGGMLNKQAASLLGISEVTLQIHRSQVMRKTQADSFADLVRMAVKLRIPHLRECRMIPSLKPGPAQSSLQGSHQGPVQSAVQ